MESKYRFYNQKRRGSCLAISENDYNVLVQGKTIKCFNSQLGSYIKIRIAKSHDENLFSKSKDHHLENHEKTCSDVSNIQSNLEEEVHGNLDIMQSMEALSGVSSYMAYEDKQANCVEGGYSSPNSEVPYFVFSANPKPKTRIRRFDAANHSSSKHYVKSIKRRKLPTYDNSLSPDTSVCRFDYNVKRKGTHPPLGFHHRTRKKLATHAYSCSCTFDCPCSRIQGPIIKSSLSSSESTAHDLENQAMQGP
ncbi:hypothetical protein RDABS01_000326 [Bienertia sinuspersici]